MKKKFFTMLSLAMLIICGAGILVLTTACGKKDYDMTNFAVEQNEFDYDGTSKNLVLSGLPEGLDYNFTYYLDEEHQDVDQLHQDAGTYQVKISFVAQKGYKTPEDKFATMKINKVAFKDVVLNVGGRYTVDNTNFETVAAKENQDGFYFGVDTGSYNVILMGTSAVGAQTEVNFYADEELTEAKSSRLMGYGSEVYMAVTLSDKNHISTTIVKKVSIEDNVFELRTFEDLTLMRSHIYGGTYKEKAVAPVSIDIRKHFVYQLMNDIDCEGGFWTPVQYIIYGGDTINNNGFVSEFDGEEHTISDYKITLDSIDQDAANDAWGGTGTQTLYLGFFGYVRDAKIHDVTLKGAEMKINKDDANFKLSENLYVIAGNVAGRISSGGSQAADATDLYNITIENGKIDINVTRQSVGGIVGEEYANQGPDGRRDHLTVKNSEIYAYSTAAHKNIFVGGLVGYTVHDAPLGTDFGPGAQKLKYSYCNVEGIKIGFNYEGLKAATTEEEKAKFKQGAPAGQYNVLAALGLELYTDYAYEVGGLFGRIYSSFEFDNCTLRDYLIATTTNVTNYTKEPMTGYWGFASEGVPVTDCDNSLDETWNGGVNGVFGIDEQAHPEYFTVNHNGTYKR